MTANQAINFIFDPKTPEETREYLRERVYRVFDEMFEEAIGKRPRRNQCVWDALERWKSGEGGVTDGGQLPKN